MLPLAAIWSPNGLIPLWQFVSIDAGTVELLCRSFLVAALGFAEPFLLLTVLLACRASNMCAPGPSSPFPFSCLPCTLS